MNRRTILKSLLAAQTAAVLPAQAPPKETSRPVEESPKVDLSVADSSADPVARFFTKDQFTALTHLCDVFEPPAGTTPGAREARAAEFLDFLLSQSPPSRQILYRAGLDRLNSESAHRYSQPFASLDAAQAATVLEPLRRPWTGQDSSDPFENFLRAAKADITEATRNSYEFISVASKRSRSAGGVGEFWYPLY
jgi:hypothetical protein